MAPAGNSTAKLPHHRRPPTGRPGGNGSSQQEPVVRGNRAGGKTTSVAAAERSEDGVTLEPLSNSVHTLKIGFHMKQYNFY
jgi:hypothetical protein